MVGDQAVTVYFIGAGPGAADLITVRGQRLLSRCPVCLYAGSIMPEDLLALCPPDARVIDTGPLTLDQIVAELADADAAGLDVARLHSGDPSIYSALAEQCRRLDALGVDYEIVPGVPAFAAAAAALGRELTVPGVAQTVTLTRVATLSTAMPAGEDLRTLSAPGATLVLHLAAAQIDAIVPQLLAGGYRPETPCAVVAFASWPQETVLRCTLADLAEQMHAADVTRTAVIVVGEVLAAEGFTDSYLYSAGRRRREPALMRVLLLGGTAEARALAARAAPATSTSSARWRAGCPTRRCRSGEVRIGGFGGVDGMRRWLAEPTRRRRRRRHPPVRGHHHRPRRRRRAASCGCRTWCWPGRRGHAATPSWSARTQKPRMPLPGNGYSRVFLTTGRSGTAAFADVDAWFLIRAVTAPDPDTLPRRHELLLSRGPYRYDGELALLRAHRIDALVTKNSGGDMTRPKLDAAAALGVPVVMVDRPPLPAGVRTVGTVEAAAAWVRSTRVGRRIRLEQSSSVADGAWQPTAASMAPTSSRRRARCVRIANGASPSRDVISGRLQHAEPVVAPAGVEVVVRDAVAQQLAVVAGRPGLLRSAPGSPAAGWWR